MPMVPARIEVIAGSVRNAALDMREFLDLGESLVGVPIIQEIGTNDLVFNNQAVNATEVEVSKEMVPAGRAWLFRISGFQGPIDYQIRVSGPTDSSPAQTIVVDVGVKGVP